MDSLKMNINRVIIFANGDFINPEFYSTLIKDKDYFICADGGAQHALKLGIMPHLVVGDLDSLDPSIYELLQNGETKFKKYPSEKDESDLELALIHALDLQPEEIIILGALGKRVDHFFANLMLLTLPLRQGIKATMIDENHEILIINKSLEVAGEKDEFISLFPLTAQVHGVTTEGLKYPLSNETLAFGPTRGLSNEFIAPIAKITITNGLLVVIKVKRNPLII